MAGSFIRTRNLAYFAGELLLSGLSDGQDPATITNFQEIESVIARGASINSEFEARFAEYSLESNHISRESPPFVRNRFLKKLSNAFIALSLRFEQVGGHIGLFANINGQRPRFVRSLAMTRAEGFISSVTVPLETIFAQKVERLSRTIPPQNSARLQPSRIPETHFSANLTAMGEKKKFGGHYIGCLLEP